MVGALSGLDVSDGAGEFFDVLSGEHAFAEPVFLGGEMSFVVGDASRESFDVFGDVFEASCDVVEAGLVLVAQASDVKGHDAHVDGDERGDESCDECFGGPDVGDDRGHWMRPVDWRSLAIWRLGDVGLFIWFSPCVLLRCKERQVRAPALQVWIRLPHL